MKICSVDECDKRHYGLSYCRSHYRSFKKYGSPLADWRKLKKKQKAALFLEKALKFTGDECLIWPFSKTQGGYGQVRIDGVAHVVHRYICEQINGAPPTRKHHAAHSCGQGMNGCVTPRHLSWKTRKENEADKVIHGTSNRGERCGAAKLTKEDVLEIRRLATSVSRSTLADIYGVKRPTISNIVHRATWKHI